MTTTLRPPPRPIIESVLGVAMLVASGVVALAGIGWRLLTLLQQIWPCGETTFTRCDLAHPEAVLLGVAMLLAIVPGAATIAGAVVAARDSGLRRSVVPPAAVALAVALAAFLTGLPMLNAALLDVVR